jgi:copper chaperone NosL
MAEKLRPEKRWWTVALVLLVLAGCAVGSATPAPPDIRYGEDVCADCNMIISDPRFAAGYAVEIEPGRFESLAFDDIGDMVSHLKNHQALKVAGLWVHDYWSDEWIDAETALYVVSSNIHSPMGHGVAAFAIESRAKQLAEEMDGNVYDWNRMRAEMLQHNH